MKRHFLAVALLICTGTLPSTQQSNKKSRNFTTIIFDLDGTIADTEVLWVEASCQLLAKRGIEITPILKNEIDILTRGLDLNTICLVLKTMFQLTDDLAILANEEEKLAHSLYETHLTFIEGFENFHAQLKELNIKCAVATNATDSAIAKTNNILKLDTFFGTHIYGISAVHGVAKPSPNIFLYTAQRLQSNPSECIVIEDSRYGVAAAKAAGMYCIGINSSGIPEFTKAADEVIKNFDELNAQTLFSREITRANR